MDNKNLFEFINKTYDNNYVEEDEIQNIINSSKGMSLNHLNISLEKTLDWLNFFFPDPDIKEAFNNSDRIRSIILFQCLYYLNIFRSLHLVRAKLGKASVGETYEHGNDFNLPILIAKGVSKLNEKTRPAGSMTEFNTVKGSDRFQTFFKIGIIGCGGIGSFLLRHLIALKDSSIMNFKILVSTRRPNNVNSDILNCLDENIEIVLDNERVFTEANLIFLCLLPHQLDLLLKEVSQCFKERVEKLKKKKNLIFPTIISTLSAVPIEKLKSIFPEEVNIHRTHINPYILNKLSEVNHYEKKFQKSSSKSILKSFLSGNSGNSGNDSMNLNNSSSDRIKKGGVIVDKEVRKFTEEAFMHLFKDCEFVEYILKSFHAAFYSIRKKNELSDINFHNALTGKYTFTYEEKFSFELLKNIFGDESNYIINSHFVNKNSVCKIKDDVKLREEVLECCKDNFMKVIGMMFKSIDY